jgi:hypothetical protein
MSDYVLVIHGTWNSPTEGQLKWFQLDPNDPENFCYRLNQQLASGPLQDSVWRPCSGTEITFQWSGDNTHEAREEGARELCTLLRKMRSADPEARLHLIAHSHGGNVALRAVERYFAQLEAEARQIVDGALTNLVRDKAPAVAIDEALKEVCGDELSKSPDLHNLTHGLILPILQDRTHAYGASYRGFYAAWSRSPESHRLGRLVFMGTPFYYKRWLPGSRLTRHVTLFINLLLLVVGIGAVFYVMVLFVGGVLSLLRQVDFVGFDPLAWPVWLLVNLGVVAPLAAIGSLMTDEEYRNVNMYYTTAPHLPKWTLGGKVQQTTPLKALVLSAGLLDEALALLSIEPLVYGFLSPVLKNRLAPPFFPSAPPIQSGINLTLLTLIKRIIQRVVQYVSAPVTAAFSRSLRWWTQPRLTELLLESASSAGFGLHVQEFSNAVVTLQKELHIPGVFEAGEVVDVTRPFAEARLRKPSPATPARLDFLWDQSALGERLQESFTWRKVQPYLRELRVRMVRQDDEFELEIRRLCAIIDVRVREFGGMVELFHSWYYADNKIIQAIAQFLEKEIRPPPIIQ